MTETGPPPGADGPEVVALLRTMLGFDTTNWGRGRSRGETPLARWVVGQLRQVGFEPLLLARPDAPERANVVLRVPGTEPDLPGLLVHAHLDVVPAEAADWSVDPFAGVLADGYVWGRGASDMKDMAAMVLATLRHWGRTGERPRRDVVVAFVADEEDRGELGAEWLVDAHPDLFAGLGAAVGESGGEFRAVRTADAGAGTPAVRCYAVSAGERGTMHLRLTATGRAGHASRPGADNPVVVLLDALHRLAHHRWPVHLAPVVRAQLSTLAAALDVEVDLDEDAGVEAALERLGEAADPARWTSRASTTPTVLEAGYKVNVIPGSASAEVDVRCPPGYDEELLAALPGLLGEGVEHTFTSFQRPVEAPVDGPWFDAIRAAVLRADPEAVVVPTCMAGGTDAKAFARLGLQCYGFAPLGEDPDGRRASGVHGVDERVPVASLLWGAAVLADLMTTT
ncbi:M20/M25/M40 family metallo-hydrolase [Microlunatus capsulatus]|uniref:Acetylornithine deacetylase/succinyl-diaminopimelate desuccinylase-like protein n=1 Tax=Microlunatus capsulatus TaxID=99117 RepID=A0ABS4Z9Z7_9ACTN|nr:M20/M25/M40 family metallo-hydrolase [Microlunatus capsulatus]MBP2417872.1 acetylornithine deacetylase/succinyl-diaminopimelate desuccinylase-like protein [Microlunatus capsulatus]